MVILIVTDKIEYHPSVHFFYLSGILSQVSGQSKKICVIDIMIPEIGLQQAAAVTT